ncbi:uncharacterized protein [Littorina saxatilis]|uniref:uncharacterized protein isoform X2 n=1 Tax=Littorina saxatilis TaxID=31220 RepID=UPI0038B644B6
MAHPIAYSCAHSNTGGPTTGKTELSEDETKNLDRMNSECSRADHVSLILGVHNGMSERKQTRVSRRRKRNAQNDVSNSGTQDEWNTMRRWVETIVEEYHYDMAKVHLQGVDPGHAYSRQDSEYLLWREDPNSFHRVGVRFQHNRHNPEIKGIKIDQPGIYVVYSQVVINGTQIRTYRRDCNHETVMIPHGGGTPTVLMSGYLTQDREGLRYPNRTIPFPRDSSLQMGQFRLLRQSEVRVRIPDHRGDCRHINFATDVHASYFGLYKIE